jgi:serine/threonine-protein kinase
MAATHVLVQEARRGRVCEVPLGAHVVLGSAEGQGFRLRDEGVAAQHCALVGRPDGRLDVRDQAGTTINGVPVGPGTVAGPGDVLGLGEARLTVLGVLRPDAPARVKGTLNVPQVLPPHYVLLRVAGKGAAGLVYEAYDRVADRRVAIKVLISGGRAIPELVERFRREVALQARLRDYPGIISVYDAGTVPDSGNLFGVMEFVTGDTLRDVVKRGVTRKEGVKLVARVARATHYAHEHGLIHRDLKPANVMVSEKGLVRLADFGLCKALEGDDGLTATGVMLGTPSYMAPEQIDDSKRVGHLADVYSLGVTLYVVLTGQIPFQGRGVGEVLAKVEESDYPPPRQVDPSIDPELAELCVECMDFVPEQRPPSAMAVARRLEAWLKRVDPPTRIKLRPPGSA